MSECERDLSIEVKNFIKLPFPFLARYLSEASGDQIKVLLAYQFLSESGGKTDTDTIADLLETTVKSVERAISYWNRERIIPLKTDDKNDMEEENLKMERQKDEDSLIEQMIVIIEISLNRELTVSEVSILSDVIHQSHFDFSLMSYLFEYCIIKKKNSFQYLKTVALSWKEKGIITAAEAERYVEGYTNTASKVSKAFGISNRMLGEAELVYVENWVKKDYPDEFIMEACRRTIIHTGQISFPYADVILKKWESEGVKSMAEIKNNDVIHQVNQPEEKKEEMVSTRVNSFHNFEQRNYDYSELERLLLQKNQK